MDVFLNEIKSFESLEVEKNIHRTNIVLCTVSPKTSQK